MARSSPLRVVFVFALLCALSVRLLTPPGWMPNLDGRGGAPLVICTGEGAHVVRLPDPDSHRRGGEDGHDLCAFAALTLGLVPPTVAFTAPRVLPATIAAMSAEDQIRFAPLWRRPQAARAPPSIT
jgi:hypothetical protein